MIKYKDGKKKEEEKVNRGVALFAVAAALLAVVDVGVLEECADIIYREMGVVTVRADGSGSSNRFVEKVLMVIYKSIARSDDCVRKNGLVRWYQKLAAQVGGGGRERELNDKRLAGNVRGRSVLSVFQMRMVINISLVT